MKITRRAGVLGLLLGALVAPAALFAQDPPPPPADAPGEQPAAAAIEGTVAQYLLNPHGEVDGLLLGDNTVVHFPPHLSAQLVALVSKQGTVKVSGFSAVKGTIRATTITNKASGQSLTDTPPTPGSRPPRPPEAGTLQEMSASGTIKALLTAPRGETDGVVLNDGTIIHFGPRNGEQFASMLVVGKSFAAKGNGVTNQYGKSLEATAMGDSTGSMKAVELGRPPGLRGPRGPRPAGGPGREGVPPPPPGEGAPVPPPQP